MRNRFFETAAKEPPVLLVAALLVVSLVSVLLVLPPAEAQKSTANTQYTSADGSRQAQPKNSKEEKPQAVAKPRAVAAAQVSADPLADKAARIIESTDDQDGITANRIVITGVNCEVGDGATITVEDANGTEITLTDGGNVDIEQGQGRIAAVGNGKNQNLRGVDVVGGDFGPSNATEVGTVVRSTGITCDREGGAKGDDGADGKDDGGVATASELVDLDCAELLQRYRNRPSGQYLTNEAFLDSDVEDRIEVCLAQEVIDDTGSDNDLPDTGGLPLLGIAVLGLASVFAGASVIRGVARGE